MQKHAFLIFLALLLMLPLLVYAGGAYDHFAYLPLLIQPEDTPTPTPTATNTPTPSPTNTPVPTNTPIPSSTPNCHASYPTVCIPPPPPDLDCTEVPYDDFVVLPPDPHRFDGDHDGVGCESP